MSTRVTVFSIVKAISLLSVMAALSINSHAQTLSVSSNQVSVTVPGTSFSSTATLANTGSVSAVTGVPTTGTLTTPTFSFTMVQTGAESSTGNFSVGIILDEQGSQRRLEVFIPTVSFTFNAGGALTGALGAQNVKIYGRDAAGATQAETSVASAGSVAFSGSTLSFSAADQIALIQAQGGILADITTSINNTGLTYDYTIILANTSGVNYTFQHSDTTAFPVAATEFVIGAGDNAVLDVNSQKLFGTVTFAASSGGGGGGGGGTTPAAEVASVEAATDELVADIASQGFTPAVTSQVNTLVASTSTAATNVAAGLKAGTTTTATGISLIASLGSQLNALNSLSITVTDTDPDKASKIDTIAAANQSLLASMKSLSTGFAGRGITASERAQLAGTIVTFSSSVQTLLNSLLTSFSLVSAQSSTAITVDTLVTDFRVLIDDYESAVSNLLTIPDFTIESSLFSSVQGISQRVGRGLLASLGTELGLSITYTNDTAAKALLSSNVALLDRLLGVSAVNIGSGATLTSTTTQAALTTAGLSATDAANLTTNLATFVNPDTFTADTGTGQVTLTSVLTSALTADSLSVDATTSRVNYTKDSNTFAVFVKSVYPAPSILPEGQFILSDGSVLIIGDELAVTLVSAANDMVEFAEAIQLAGSGSFTTAASSNGHVSLNETASSVVFSSLFSSAALSSTTAASTTSFEAPSGDPAASSYRFVINYKDGTSQEILPAIADSAFFTSVENAGFAILIDRLTGGINIGGFNFRPDFFQTPLDTAASTYLTENADSSGVAYRTTDANGDGRTDYQILTATGIQTVYGLP